MVMICDEESTHYVCGLEKQQSAGVLRTGSSDKLMTPRAALLSCLPCGLQGSAVRILGDLETLTLKIRTPGYAV